MHQHQHILEVIKMTCCHDINWFDIYWQRLSVAGVSGPTWNAAGREGGLLVPKLAKERGSKAVGDEQSPNPPTSAALLYEHIL